MTVLITLTTAGTDSGPFDLYSDLDGYLSAFESGVSKASLEAGYASSLVPDYTNTIRVKSNGVLCTNSVNIIVGTTTTTTTTSTTTTTTTAAPYALYSGVISTYSDPSDACSILTDVFCWIYTDNPADLTQDSIVFSDSGGTSLFIGDGEYYHIKFTAGTVYYSATVSPTGVIGFPVLCP
jgi:hypothetical protein